MNPREQTLSLVLLGAIALTVAGAGGYFFIWQPLQRQNAAMQTLGQEIADLDAQVAAQAATQKKLAVARTRSLPADEAMARREYTVALERIIETAGVSSKGYTITPKSVETRSVPELSKGKPIYTKIAYEVILKKVDMWMLKDFLEGYYRLGLLHQITNFVIKKDDDNTGKGATRRNDLTVTFTTEAIIVDGADNRRTLLPVPTAYAAIGGGAMYKGIAATPEAGRAVSPQPLVPVLASKGRDYSLIVRKDPFHGPWIDQKEQPLKIKVADVKIKSDEKPDAPRITVSGDGHVGAKVTAIASGSLFPEGALKVELRTTGLYSIELPTTSATEGTATVSVIATSADGKVTEKASFKVSLEEKPVDLGESLSGVILLIGITSGSDGTARARVVDNANRHRYQIDATAKGITVVKESTLGPDRPWKSDSDYAKLPAGVLELPETTKITRTFKLIAVTAEGLVLADIKPGSVPKAGGKGGPPPRPVKQPASPLAALGGNMIAAVPAPKYYRWAVGQPLANIKPIPPDEVKLILKTAEATGPVFDIADAR